MEEADTPDPPQEERADPPTLAETCMRELVGRASFGHIRSVLRPVLRYVVTRQEMFPMLIQQRKCEDACHYEHSSYLGVVCKS